MLDYVIARKNPLQPKDVILELHGSPLFAIRQKIVSPQTTEGTIILLGPLDFETQSMYHLTVLANVSNGKKLSFWAAMDIESMWFMEWVNRASSNGKK